MSNAVTIILIVGVAAVGIAYFTNMFCQASGGVICYPPASTSFIPQAPGEKITADPTTQEYAIPKSNLDLMKSYNELLATTIGGSTAMPKPSPPRKFTSKLTGALSPAQSTQICKMTKGSGYCWSEGAGGCVKCGSTGAGANFAESEAYYVRTA